jgi:hypothetical protein
MTGGRHSIGKTIRLVTLLALIAVPVLTLSGVLPFQQFTSTSRTMLSVAADNADDLLGLGIICAGAGIFVMSDRRRRARGRQASS